MGTDGLVVVTKGGEKVIAQYTNCDSYPTGHGETIVNFLKTLNLEHFKKKVDALNFIEEFDDTHMTSTSIKANRHDYPGADVLQLINDSDITEVEDFSEHEEECLSYEWTYYIDLDNETVTIYTAICIDEISTKNVLSVLTDLYGNKDLALTQLKTFSDDTDYFVDGSNGESFKLFSVPFDLFKNLTYKQLALLEELEQEPEQEQEQEQEQEDKKIKDKDTVKAVVITSPTSVSKSCTNLEMHQIFLGGTIANGQAPNWQADIAQWLSDLPIYILNPRRVDWNPNADDEDKKTQIKWEIDAQNNSDFIIYYFDPNFTNPITLLELGLYHYSNVIVYCPKEYPYYLNVSLVCKTFDIPCFETIGEAVAKLREEIIKCDIHHGVRI